jgi:glycosyltransferase involved in cell wall biosynthesis
MTELPREVAFYTDARAWGGAEVYLTQLLESARSAGLKSRVFCADREEARAWFEDLERRGFTVALFRPTKEFNPLGFFVAHRLLRGHRIVHFNKTHPRNCLPGIAAARWSGAEAVIATEHLATPPVSHVPLGRLIITLLVRLTNRLIDATIAVSELSRQELIENYSVQPSRIVTIRNGIDLTRFDAAFDVGAVRDGLGIGEGDQVGVLVGAFVARKGHRYALRAVPAIRKRIPRFRMVFAGSGPLEQELRAEAERMGAPDAVVFAGFRRDVPAVLAASDVLLLPSENECLPMVILEAMASGLPVIATDVAGISEAVEDGVTGRLVAAGDTEGLARAVIEILGDPDRAQAMGAAGRKRVETDFTAAKSAAAVFRLYEEILGWKGRP